MIERDIGVQETCQMLLEIPLLESSRRFVNLNVSKEVVKHVDLNANDDHDLHRPSFIDAYKNRPQFMEVVYLIDGMKSWISKHKRKNQNIWNPRNVRAIT